VPPGAPRAHKGPVQKPGFWEKRLEELLQKYHIVTIAIEFAVLLFSLSIHEAAHAWMADRQGDFTARYLGRVSLNPIAHIDPIGTLVFPLLQLFTQAPLIGWAKPVPMNSLHLRNPRRDHMLISFAGPGANLLAGSIAFLLLFILKKSSFQGAVLVRSAVEAWGIPSHESILAPIIGILLFVMTTNISLAIFNLIPIPPLDGHWILYELLPSNAAAAFERLGSYGFIILYALMFMGAFQFVFIPITYVRKFLYQW
jgi:Zn-dependent protease